jgi:GT2 family glycosyltransferase
VDNGSSDGSIEHVKANYPDVKLIALKENTGFCHAVNVGIKNADTDYVILLNNDTTVHHGFTRSLTSAIEQDERIFSVAAKMLNMENPEIIDDAGNFYNALGWAYARGKGKNNARYLNETDIFASCAGAAIYRRSYLEELGYFDEAHFAYLEDIDIGYAARLRGYKNRFCPEAEVVHAGSAASGSRYNDFKTDLTSRNSIYIIFKNMPILQIIFNLPFLLLGFFIKFLFFCRKGMGLRYLRGLGQGFKLSFSEVGRSHKVRFRWKYLRYYLIIQIELFINIFRRFM